MKITPVASFNLLGGKYFLDSEAASFEGRMDAYFSPAINLREGHDLVPVYSGNYSGTQDVQELAGGGVLTRQRQSHSVSLKYIYTRDFDKYKPRISYSKALVRETKDESWGDGLFDYDTVSLGFEAEQERPHGTFTESYDFFSVSYPNYATLLSDSQSVFTDTDTFNQLSTNAGENPMDNVSHRLAFSYSWFPERAAMRAGYDITYRHYDEQAIINNQDSTGLPPFSGDKRSDIAQNFTLSASRALKPVFVSAGARVGWLSSNQGSYDNTRQKYMDDYYSYIDISLTPAMTLALKNGSQFRFGLEWRKVFYLGRLKQAADGTYGNEEIDQTYWLTSISARYPVFGRLYARGAFNYQLSDSNMRYEDNYRYNYKASTYLVGVEWEF
ncbi:MAG TPA: hypothetical protein DDW67_07020 [Elusimicrobia bacterium]|nr:hypothetical protein [Elusimicrobiota bacterium]